MATEYYQIPCQQSFLSATNADDAWIPKAAASKSKAVTTSQDAAISEIDVLSKKASQISLAQFAIVTGPDWGNANVVVPLVKPTEKPIRNDSATPLNLKDIIELEEPPNLYKTELCKSFQETGTCKYTAKCQFAHGMKELRQTSRHPKYKTEICKTFQNSGKCPYGPRCRFIHSRAIDVPTPASEEAAPTTAWSTSWDSKKSSSKSSSPAASSSKHVEKAQDAPATRPRMSKDEVDKKRRELILSHMTSAPTK